MRTTFLFLAAAVMACGPLDGSGGANPNDRTHGGQPGELLLTGAMEVSPDGAFLIEQRTTATVLVDVKAQTATELAARGDRFVFSKKRHVVYEVLPNRAGIVALDLDQGAKVLWTSNPVFVTTAGAMLARVSDDDQTLILGDYNRLLAVDAQTGSVRGAVSMNTLPTDLAFLSDHKRAMVVGTVQWSDHKPATEVVVFDLATLAMKTITIPNCDAPIALMPDSSRAFVSPTYCEEGKATNPNGQWTNPDPVSVIDLDLQGAHFLKNLPGFGPVALDSKGARAVAYLDTKRMDPAMFANPAQVPSLNGDQFHLMVIDPLTLSFSLSPIGNALPRFAMTPDGSALLVDSSVKVARGGAYASVTIGPDGLTAEAGVFGGQKSPFGIFDITGKQYTAFTGAVAALDRFVITSDNKVFTLKLTADGTGGDLFVIDLGARTTLNLSRSLRDIGEMPDGKTLILRIRMPAATINNQKYLQEDYCFSLDGVSCTSTIHFTGKTPVPNCAHDCAP